MIKQELKNRIAMMKECDNQKDIDFPLFLKQTELLLNEYDCSFRFLRSDSRANGKLSAKVNRKTGEYTLNLAINRNDTIAGMVYTICHELTHLINNHIFSKDLSRKQGEVVADTVAWYFINKFNLRDQYLKSSAAKKWDVENYSNIYIDSMAISKHRYQVIIEQIATSKVYIERNYL